MLVQYTFYTRYPRVIRIQTFSLSTLVGVETVFNDSFAFSPDKSGAVRHIIKKPIA